MSIDKNELLEPKVTVILTGGTIEKTYDAQLEGMSFSKARIVRDAFDQMLAGSIEFVELSEIDSLEMRDGDRSALSEEIEKEESGRVIVVHGTSTMGTTAEHLFDLFSTEKTIVLTGALFPISYSPIEGSANLGASLCAARYFDPGVYIAMHGLAVRHCDIMKDQNTGRFVKTVP